VTGCGSWRAITPPAPPAPPPAAQEPARPPAQEIGSVRVRLADGGAFEVRHATLDADSVRGEWIVAQRGERGGGPVAFARADVRAIERHRVDGTATAIILFGVGVTAALVAALGGTKPHPPILLPAHATHP
jgi:hypothetical protein